MPIIMTLMMQKRNENGDAAVIRKTEMWTTLPSVEPRHKQRRITKAITANANDNRMTE